MPTSPSSLPEGNDEGIVVMQGILHGPRLVLTHAVQGLFGSVQDLTTHWAPLYFGQGQAYPSWSHKDGHQRRRNRFTANWCYVGLRQTRIPSRAPAAMGLCLPEFGSPDHSGLPCPTCRARPELEWVEYYTCSEMGSYFRPTLVTTQFTGPALRSDQNFHPPDGPTQTRRNSRREHSTPLAISGVWTSFPRSIGLLPVVARSSFRRLLPKSF